MPARLLAPVLLLLLQAMPLSVEAGLNVGVFAARGLVAGRVDALGSASGHAETERGQAGVVRLGLAGPGCRGGRRSRRAR